MVPMDKEKKYIKTLEVVKLTERSYDEILNLVNTGALSGYKTRRGHWRIKLDSVEEYFGIQIKKPTEDISSERKHAPKSSKPVPEDKLICGHTARKYLGCSKAEFEILVKQGKIKAYRDDQKRWKVSKDSVLNYAQQSLPSSDTRIITNESHYEEVIERICSAKSSIKIMTGDLKLLRLKPTAEQGTKYLDGTPFINFLMDKAKQGVSVQIIYSDPSKNVDEELKGYFRKLNSYPFSTRNCVRNHAKAVVIDDNLAYIGSANATRAGLGQYNPRNFEMGILTENPAIITSVKSLFSKIWDGDYCEGCYRAKHCPEY